jgi:DNA-binding CsgD family transcriptional regulator
MLGSTRQLALQDHAERIAGLGSWEWTPATGRLWWSDNHFRLYGMEPQAAEPSLEYLLDRVHPDDRRLVHETAVMLTGDEFRDLGLEYRIFHTDGTIRRLQVTFSTIEEGGGTPKRIVGSVRDVTFERRTDQQLAAHHETTLALDDWTALVPGAETLLRRLATAMGLAFGAFWVPDKSSLTARATWHLASASLEAVDESTRARSPGLACGGIGRAFTSRRPVVLAQPSLGDPPARSAAMRLAAISSALAIPAVAADDVLAVIELLSFDPIEATERLLQALDRIGHQVGQFLSHRRGELTTPVLTPRELEVLQLAAQGQSAASIATELFLSPATVKRHFERAYARLDVPDRASAVAEAMRRGMIR